MKELILGTVQLGLRYGVNNQSGKPSMEDSYRILDYAHSHGISYLDTAEDYGNSEEVIGSFLKESRKAFRVCTKLSSKFDSFTSFIYEGLKERVDASRQRVRADKIYLYYLHSFLHCNNKELLEALAKLRRENLIESIGISVYEPAELEYILMNCADVFDVVQIPFNILDHSRWLKNGLLSRAKQSNIKVFIRSIFLQGLLLKDERDETIKRLHAGRYIRFLKALAEERGTTILSMAYCFVSQVEEIDGILIGCESVEQLKQNIALREMSPVLDDKDIVKIKEFCTIVDDKIIDPRKW